MSSELRRGTCTAPVHSWVCKAPLGYAVLHRRKVHPLYWSDSLHFQTPILGCMVRWELGVPHAHILPSYLIREAWKWQLFHLRQEVSVSSGKLPFWDKSLQAACVHLSYGCTGFQGFYQSKHGCCFPVGGSFAPGCPSSDTAEPPTWATNWSISAAAQWIASSPLAFQKFERDLNPNFCAIMLGKCI